MTSSRVRRAPEEARRLILEEAERLLVEGGVGAVQVRAIAARVGMTDAGITHHFGSRSGLLEALLRHGGRRIRGAVGEVVSRWAEDGARLTPLVDALADLYQDGYSELAIALHAAGWRDRGSGLLDPVVEALHAAPRPASTHRPSLDDTRLAVAALHQALAIDPVYGSAFRRSAGIPTKSATNPTPQRHWWLTHLSTTLNLPK
jgi:AcrR family transcriptional regulator